MTSFEQCRRTSNAICQIRAAYTPCEFVRTGTDLTGGGLYAIRWRMGGPIDRHDEDTLIDVANDDATQMKLGASWRRI